MTRPRTARPGRPAELPAAGTVREHGRPPAVSPARRVCSSQAAPGWTVVSAGLSPVLLTAGWLAAGALQPPPYSPIRQTISALAGHAGTDRWIMTGALFLIGGCYLVTAAGLAGVSAPARVLLCVAGLSSAGIAASPESARGPDPQHLAWTALGAITIAVWPAFTARRASPRPLILGIGGSAAATAVFTVLLGWLVIQAHGGSNLGLAERLTTSVQTSWPFIVAVALRRTTPRTPRQEPQVPPGTLPTGPGAQEPPAGPQFLAPGHAD